MIIDAAEIFRVRDKKDSTRSPAIQRSSDQPTNPAAYAQMSGVHSSPTVYSSPNGGADAIASAVTECNGLCELVTSLLGH